MATGAASQLAVRAGVGVLRVPLLWLAVAVALTVVVRTAAAPGRRPRRDGVATRFGDFTVPIGLAVIGGGLARLGGAAAVTGTFVLLGAWVVTGVLLATVVGPLVTSLGAAPLGLEAVDGTWFLAPAALLADAIGVAAMAGPLSGHSPALRWLALAAAGAGAIGYLLVVALGAARVLVHGLGGTPLAAWWIAAGCGGLSAAALGRAASLDPAGGGAAALHGFGWAAMACWAVGSVWLVPVLAASLRSLASLRRASGRPPWPPTFSTGVYALGAAQVGHLLVTASITRLADLAAAATIGLWALTVCAHLPRALGRGRHRRAALEQAGRGGPPPGPS